jgi:hypothetical protein
VSKWGELRGVRLHKPTLRRGGRVEVQKSQRGLSLALLPGKDVFFEIADMATEANAARTHVPVPPVHDGP